MERPKKGQRYLYSMLDEKDKVIYSDMELYELAEKCGISYSYLKQLAMNGYTYRNKYHFTRRVAHYDNSYIHSGDIKDFSDEWMNVTRSILKKCNYNIA